MTVAAYTAIFQYLPLAPLTTTAVLLNAQWHFSTMLVVESRRAHGSGAEKQKTTKISTANWSCAAYSSPSGRERVSCLRDNGSNEIRHVMARKLMHIICSPTQIGPEKLPRKRTATIPEPATCFQSPGFRHTAKHFLEASIQPCHCEGHRSLSQAPSCCSSLHSATK